MVWRRFLPPKKQWRAKGKLSDPTMGEPMSVYAEARLLADDLLRQTRSKKRDTVYKQAIDAIKLLRVFKQPTPAQLLALLILQTPQAARAQDDMDKHRGGYSNRQARVYELIDFNDTFVDLVLSVPVEEHPVLADRIWNELANFCEKYHAMSFREEQFDAIVHGLSREIAVYQGARAEGLHARMTSRVQDARGIDMVITDPTTRRSIEVDCKTHSSFHFRLLHLEQKRRIDAEYRMRCELAGFCPIVGGPKSEQSHTILLRIATDELGPIRDFAFEDTRLLGERLRVAIAEHGKIIVNG
ncbi:MAG TPA: hypothetical protein VGE13_02245 [Candidatus Saccharimonadales bacterium]